MADELNITKSLFGVGPAAFGIQPAADELGRVEQRAVATAGLDAMQQARYIANRGASLAGFGLGKAAIEGGLFGEEAQDPRLKLAQTTQAIMRDLTMENFNFNNPVEVKKEVARRLVAAGFPQQATALAQEAQMDLLNQQKLQAETGAKQAAAIKDLTQATNEQSPMQRLIATGKFTPASLAKYNQTNDIKDLVLADDNYALANTAEGVFLYDKRDPNAPRIRVGSPVTEGDAKAKLRTSLSALMREVTAKYEQPGDTPEMVIERLKAADMNTWRELAAMAKEAVGADNLSEYFGAMKPLTEAQENLVNYSATATHAKKVIDEKGWGTKRALPDLTKVMNALQAAAAKNPNQTIPLEVVLNQYGDKDTREYLADYFGYLLPVLRKDTGAAIANSEWVNYFQTYIPQSNANESDNKSRVERLNERERIFRGMVEGNPNTRKARDTIIRLRAKEEEAVKAKAGLVGAGRAAKAKGREEYIRWYNTLTPEQREQYNMAIKTNG